MRITSKGQVTIPRDIRERAGFLPDTEVEFIYTGGKVLIQKSGNNRTRGRKIVDALRGKGTVRMTTRQIMQLTRE